MEKLLDRISNYEQEQMPVMSMLHSLRDLDLNKDLIKNETLRKVFDAYITKTAKELLDAIQDKTQPIN